MVKADWLRCILLFAEGAMWSGLDASCNEIPIDEWMPTQFKGDASLLVGWEFDVGWGPYVIHQLAAWTMLAKPGLPCMMAAIDDVCEAAHNVAHENHVEIANITVPMLGDIVDFSGPRRMTRSVFKSLQQTLNETDETFKETESRTWFAIEPNLIHDILILPGWSFAKSVNTYDETVSVGPPPLITHHYAGS